MKFVQNRDGGTGGSAGDQGQVNHPFKAITLNFLNNATQATSVTTTLFGGISRITTMFRDVATEED